MKQSLTPRIDFHTHTLLSDGELTPSELVRRAAAKGFSAIGITDHADAANMDNLINSLQNFIQYSRDNFAIRVICGLELTHVPPENIYTLAQKAKNSGIELVIVHGETPVEPVATGTNKAAIEAAEYIDILAHPGFISQEEARLARDKGIYLELTSRKGHCWTNGHVAKTARESGCKLLVNTDTHGPGDLISYDDALKVARGAGLSDKEALSVINDNANELLSRLHSQYC